MDLKKTLEQNTKNFHQLPDSFNFHKKEKIGFFIFGKQQRPILDRAKLKLTWMNYVKILFNDQGATTYMNNAEYMKPKIIECEITHEMKWRPIKVQITMTFTQKFQNNYSRHSKEILQQSKSIRHHETAFGIVNPTSISLLRKRPLPFWPLTSNKPLEIILTLLLFIG